MHRLATVSAAALVALVAACTSSGTQGSPQSAPAGSTAGSVSSRPAQTSSAPASTSPPSSGAASHPTTSAPASSGSGSGGAAARVLAGMSLAQEVGQLLMVDCPSTGVSSSALAAIRDRYAGSVILDGNSTLSVSGIRSLTSRLQAAAPSGQGLFVATDQEGGLVRRLRGPGFTAMPSAVVQGGTSPSTLRGQAAGWGRELRAAGVNVDLAPVLDTVPAGSTGNPPIGDLDREYGRTPAAVSSHGNAVREGLADAGVDATVKHFPGLGRVSGNTDTTVGVTDTQTTRDDAYLAPFRAAVDGGVPFVMMSTAVYLRIDPGTPAAFSPTIVTGMLRGDLGFRGVIISDDLGVAKQVADLSPGQRAVDFVRAGGDIVLTVDDSVVPAMADALIAEARASASFRAQVDAAALVVLQAKQARGLLG